MPSCVFRKCSNYTATVKDNKNVSFHSLPRDGLLREKWIRVIRAQRREEDWMPSAYTTICSKHFRPGDTYITDKNIRRLKKTAVPAIKIKEDVEEQNPSSPSSLVQVNISDEESIFERPEVTYLKSKIEQLSAEKRKLQISNYNLTRKNKRLKEKCTILIKIVSKLRKKVVKSKVKTDESEFITEADLTDEKS